MSTSLIPVLYSELMSRGMKAQQFLSSGTWIRPSPRITVAWIFALGGGGSGGVVAGVPARGGSSGEVILPFFPWFVDDDVAVTIGAGGDGRSSAGAGATGGSTSFGTLVVARGGAGGLRGTTGMGPVHDNSMISLGGGAGGSSSGTGGSAGDMRPVLRGVGGSNTSFSGHSAGGGAGAWGNGTNASQNSSTPAAGSGAGSGAGNVSSGSGGSGRLIVFWQE